MKLELSTEQLKKVIYFIDKDIKVEEQPLGFLYNVYDGDGNLLFTSSSPAIVIARTSMHVKGKAKYDGKMEVINNIKESLLIS